MLSIRSNDTLLRARFATKAVRPSWPIDKPEGWRPTLIVSTSFGSCAVTCGCAGSDMSNTITESPPPGPLRPAAAAQHGLPAMPISNWLGRAAVRNGAAAASSSIWYDVASATVARIENSSRWRML